VNTRAAARLVEAERRGRTRPRSRHATIVTVQPASAPPIEPVAGQSFRERQPAPAVAGHLSSVWIQRVSVDAAPYTHRTVPHGSIEIAVELGSAPRVVGPQTGPVVATADPGITVVGLRFHPGVAPAVLGVPASELVDRSVGWDELRGSSAVELGETIAAAASPWQAAAMLERAVWNLLADAAEPDPVVRAAVRLLQPWGTADVRSLTSSLYISERQLRRRSLAAIGLAPKLVQRMLRFQGFLALAGSHEPESADLSMLAADTGYADQSHLTHESLQLAGVTPRALLAEAAVSCVGIHDHTASRAPLLRTRALSRAA
jgi:AraC-like DNA-binding protein